MTNQEPPPDPPLSPDSVLRDWMTLWQSEAAAIAVDRELQENWARAVQGWIGHFTPAAGHEPARDPQSAAARADAAARPPPAAAASDAEPRTIPEPVGLAGLRDEISQLRRRIEQLESAAVPRPARAAAASKPGGRT